jgi:hypothetical protein
MFGKKDFVELLMKKEVNLDHKNINGKTAFHMGIKI